MTPEAFYDTSKAKQAEMIWKALFLDRIPLSEACRGVVSTLSALGLDTNETDLDRLRQAYYKLCPDASSFCDMVFRKAGVRYAIMTNIPFDGTEARYWRPKREEYSTQFRSALRVDAFLSGDITTISTALTAGGYECTAAGARLYLLDWCDTMQPEYVMASTPHDMTVDDTGTVVLSAAAQKRRMLNERALNEPGAFAVAAAVAGSATSCCDGDDNDNRAPSFIDEDSDLFATVLMPLCEERGLPLALKVGAHRGVNPSLRSAGDGVAAQVDVSLLGRLCARYPNVRFLATFLARTSQHEAVVLARKFRNLHIYGCWWFCNNPSIIQEITTMRLEMLGTAFTAQHSDARVIDQLLYKWAHSRAVIACVLSEQLEKVTESGRLFVTRAQIRREVSRLFGGSYEEFMQR